MRTTLARILLTITPCLAVAYDDMLVEHVAYDDAIPTPEAYLGHRLGHAPVRHHQLTGYLEAVSALSPRLTAEVIGESHERRPIIMVVATSPANHGRLADIRAAQVARTEGGEVPADLPTVTWITFGVHGAEESGMDAALPLVYHLAAARGPAIERQLAEAVTLVVAVVNPDGHARRIAWGDQGSMANANTNPENRIHNPDWPGARTNHYWFDLNRQWLLVTQPEARGWVRKWHEWRPNLTIDYHEMNPERSYYFHPGTPTRYQPLIPQTARDLTVTYAKYSSTWLDSEGWLYFNEEGYDNYYIGKGSTYPLVNGGVGILYEAGSARGGVIEGDNGYVHSYRENIRKHYRTAVAGLEAAVDMRDDLQRHQREFYDTALTAAARDSTRAYVFAAPDDPYRVAQFIDLLRHHRIEVHALARDVAAGEQQFRAGNAYVVALAQRQYRMARAVFETVTEFEDETFYDVSTWTMPLSFNLDYAPLVGRRFDAEILGDRIEALPLAAPPPDRAAYGYVFDWSSYLTPKALNRLQAAGVKTRVLAEATVVPTTRGDVGLAPGAILVPFEHQSVDGEAIHGAMAAVAARDHIPVHAVTSGWTPEGPQLGADSSIGLERPEVLLLAGDPLSSYEVGEAWHLLDQRMGMAITLMDLRGLPDARLSRYTHIVLVASGRGGGPPIEDEEMIGALADWIEDGGTFMAQRGGAVWAQRQFLQQSGSREDKEEHKDEAPAVGRLDYAQLDDRRAQEVIGGAIFGSDLDISHPLGFGYDRRLLPSHRSGTHVLEPTDNPFAVVAAYRDDEPRLSGFASDEQRKRIAGTPMLIAERKGEGAVILYADNPNFRAIWYGTAKLFMNGIFFSKAFERPPRSLLAKPAPSPSKK